MHETATLHGIVTLMSD